MASEENKKTKPLSFELNRALLSKGSALAVELSSDIPKAIADALANNSRVFPPGNFTLGSTQIKSRREKDIVFQKKSTGTKVAFRGSGGMHAGLALLDDPEKRLKDLGFDQTGKLDLSFDSPKDTRYLMLSWGCVTEASGKGSLALGGPGKATLGLEAARDASFVLLRRISSKAKALPTLTETFSCWRLPSQVRTTEDIPPDSWIITEVDGSIAVKLGAQFGYDFSWIKELKTAGLKGDYGLKVKLGADIALGFNASGRYALVLHRSRSKPKTIRLRIFKVKNKGWDFAFNSAASVDLIAPDLPLEADDFIKALLGVHGSQILRDLQTLEKWIHPKKPMGQLIGALGIDYGYELLAEITGIDANRSLVRARKSLLGALAKWNGLAAETAAAVWKMLDEDNNGNPQNASRAIKEVRDFAHAIVNSDAQAIGKLIAVRLSGAGYPHTPVGQWLESLSGGSVLGLLRRTGYVRDAARKILAVLDEGKVEFVIRRIQQVIGKRLNLDRVIHFISDNDIAKLDLWLKLKLAEFIDGTMESLDSEDVLDIRRTIRIILKKRCEFYKQAAVALTRKYQFNFAAAYQNATTRAALLDVEFSFTRKGPEVSKLLHSAINGDFSRILLDDVNGVTLNAAALTHGIKRQADVDISLPYFSRRSKHISEALSRVDVAEDGGRLLLYDLRAKDRVTAANRLLSELAVTANWPVRSMEPIRIWNSREGSISYRFRQARSMNKTEELEFQLRPIIAKYFGNHFGDGGGTLRDWMRKLGVYVDAADPGRGGRIGNTLLSIDLDYPIEVLAGWMHAPRKQYTKEYREMAKAIQRSLRELIPFYYFQNPDHYMPLEAAAPLLVYKNLPVSAQIRLTRNRLTLNTGKGIFWDWRQKRKLEAMSLHPSSRKGLEEERARIARLLETIGKKRAANLYRIFSAEALIGLSLRGQARMNLENLMFVEEDVIRSAVKAGQKITRFLEAAPNSPGRAIGALAEYGAGLTESFNRHICSIYGADALRCLGPLILVEASRALLSSGKGAAPKPNALLTLSLLKKGARPFPPKGFPDNPPTKPEDLIIEDRLVAVGSDR